jgi:Fe-S oxidoreductase
MFIEDYRELRLPDAERVARRCVLFQEFLEGLLTREPAALRFNTREEKVIIHSHCHIKSTARAGYSKRLGERLPGRTVAMLDTGCCGMAGGFGFQESKYDLSVRIAEPLIREVRGQPFGTTFVTAGASCRGQVQHLTPIRSRHMAEVLAEALV